MAGKKQAAKTPAKPSSDDTKHAVVQSVTADGDVYYFDEAARQRAESRKKK